MSAADMRGRLLVVLRERRDELTAQASSTFWNSGLGNVKKWMAEGFAMVLHEVERTEPLPNEAVRDYLTRVQERAAQWRSLGPDSDGEGWYESGFDEALLVLTRSAPHFLVAPPASEWIHVPAGTWTLGLTRDEARRYAQAVAKKNTDDYEADPDPLHGLREWGRIQATAGNPEHLEKHLLRRYRAHEVAYREHWITKRPYGDGLPVRLNWADADAQARMLGARLPTEVEWERLARGPERAFMPARGGAHLEEFGHVGFFGEWCADVHAPYPGDTLTEHEAKYSERRVRRACDDEDLPPSAVTRRFGTPTRLELRFRLCRDSPP